MAVDEEFVVERPEKIIRRNNANRNNTPHQNLASEAVTRVSINFGTHTKIFLIKF